MPIFPEYSRNNTMNTPTRPRAIYSYSFSVNAKVEKHLLQFALNSKDAPIDVIPRARRIDARRY